jgi:hypothetical protein
VTDRLLDTPSAAGPLSQTPTLARAT